MVKPIKKKKKADIADLYISLPEKFMEALSTNFRMIAMSAGGILAVAIIIAGVFYYYNQKQQSASEAFFSAMDTYREEAEAVAGSDNDQTPQKLSYVRTIEEFNNVIKNYGGSAYALWSGIYIGNCYRGMGDLDKAKNHYIDFIKTYNKNDIFMFEAYQNLTVTLLDSRQYDEVIKYSKEYILKENAIMPEGFLKRIAFCYEELKDIKNAEITYRRISEEYPDSPLSGMAKQKADDLRLIIMQGL